MEKRTAIVTGASRGIGLATARMLAGEGYIVYGFSRSEGGLKTPDRPSDEVTGRIADAQVKITETIRESTGYSSPAPRWVNCDVTDEDSIRSAFDRVLGETGRIDVLVCNAGMGISGAAEFTPVDDYLMEMDVNVTGAIRCAQAAIPVMREQGNGRIVFMSSLAAIFPLPFQSFYSVSKASLNAFSDAAGIELAPFGIQTSAVMLNDVKTDFTENRRKTVTGDDIYGGRISKSVEKMEKSEQSGMSPQQVAKTVCSILRRRKLPSHKIVGVGNEFLGVLYRILPTDLMLRLLAMIYG